MRCGSIILLALAGAGLLAPSAGAASSLSEEEASFNIKLKATHGLAAELESQPGEDGEVTLTVKGRRQQVVYKATGEVSREGIEVRFGRLGRFSAGFRPFRTLEVEEPPPGCRGEPRISSLGYFTGTIRFRGERDYVRIEAGRAKGELRVFPGWECSRRALAEPVLRLTSGGDEPEEAALTARLPQADHLFAALGFGGESSENGRIFYGGIREGREGMQIVRLAYAATARARTFRFDHQTGTATVAPPWPFRGSASFRRHPGGANEWRGRLSVPLLGHPPIRLAGPGFVAHMKDEIELE